MTTLLFKELSILIQQSIQPKQPKKQPKLHQEETETQEEQLLTIDELLELGEEDYEEFTDDANHKGMKPLHEWMQHIPEDARKHVANIRSSYTRKTQELAEMRKQLEVEREQHIVSKICL